MMGIDTGTGRKISTSFAESTVNQVMSRRMVTLASRSMYTNHWQLNARQAGIRIVRSPVRQNRVCRHPEHESPEKNTCPRSTIFLTLRTG
jgi:hypothetical protein